jgi:hypothetical protein
LQAEEGLGQQEKENGDEESTPSFGDEILLTVLVCEERIGGSF